MPSEIKAFGVRSEILKALKRGFLNGGLSGRRLKA
jgi:hypothetical protein